MRLPVNQALPFAALMLAGGCGHALAKPPAATVAAPTGPAADYPVTVGAPYTIGTTTWTPADQLNYDAVGFAGVADGLSGIAAAHKTLPLPSYAEVTALDTGRTILVRIVERGPRDNETLVALSGPAATQLGLAPGARSPVRVRRVNPPEIERAAIRTGGTAPMRMETPDSLLKVLRRKLAEQSPLMPPPSVPPAMPTNIAAGLPKSAPITAAPPELSRPVPAASNKPSKPAERLPASKPKPEAVVSRRAPQVTPVARNTPAAPSTPATRTKGSHVVQVAAFSTRDRADKAARQLGGTVTPAGRLWRVRIGPFPGSGEAASALEKAKAAGYRDARIQRAD
jgi:rare lipoprotein A